jgi:hypothetical protein
MTTRSNKASEQASANYIESDDSSDESVSSWNTNRSGTSSFACESLVDDSDDYDDSDTEVIEADSKWGENSFFQTENIDFKGQVPDYRQPFDQPLKFFHEFISKSMFKTIMEQTNLYANSKGIALNVTTEEIEQYVGILIHMGTFTMSNPKDYWKQRSRYPTIADTMNQNRFCKIKYNFHIVDNIIQFAKPDADIDKLFKVRPLYDHVLANCKKLDVPEYLSIGTFY